MKIYFKLLIIISLSLISISSFNTFCHAQTPVFFGMTYEGGTNISGVITRFDPITGKDTVVWNFGGTGDGVNPNGDLVYDPNNKLLYGLTIQGGAYSAGTIFSFNPVTLQENVLYSLGNGSDGQFPWGSLVFDPANGLFYATADMGGSHGSGAIISFDPATNVEQVVYSFAGGKTDGQYPVGNPAYDAGTGLFYIMTNYGGVKDVGAIVSFDPATNKENLLWSLGTSIDGSKPYSTLTYSAADGLFYGMTKSGGINNKGAIISLDPATNEENVVWSFGTGTDGYGPYSSFVYDAAKGLLYGMTVNGGSNDLGAIISFNPTTKEENVVYSFGTGTDGQHPYSYMAYYPNNGLYYAMAYQGGNNTYGAIISFNPETLKDSVLYSFHSFSTDGYFPMNALTLYDPNEPSAVNSLTVSATLNIYPNPANGLFNISGLSHGQRMDLYNYAGQKISSRIAVNATEQLHINDANGLYLLRILNADGTLAVRKEIVKTN